MSVRMPMVAADPKSAKAQDASAAPDGASADDLIASEDFQQKLERARARRARALAGPPAAQAPRRPPPPLILAVEAQVGEEEGPAVPSLAAPARPDPQPRDAKRRVRTLLAHLLVGATVGAAAGIVLLEVLATPESPPAEPLAPRRFAIQDRAPDAPAPPATRDAPAPGLPAGAPATSPLPAPEADLAARSASTLGDPPAPDLSTYADTPVRLLGTGTERAAEISDRLRDAGLETVSARSVGIAPARTVIRYFDAADRPLAQGLARRLGAEVQDLTSYRPAPSAPGVEIWLGGS